MATDSSSASSVICIPERPAAAAAVPSAWTKRGVIAGLFVATFGFLLASFPARNAELWSHLAAGRALAHGAFTQVSPTWLYDVISYALFISCGGAGLVAVKAALVASLAVVLVRLSRSSENWLVPVACTVLALLTVANRALLAPAMDSYLLFAIALQVSGLRGQRSDQPLSTSDSWPAWPGWSLVLLFVVWANTDRWFLLGLVVVALIRLGQWLDPPRRDCHGLLQALTTLLVLAAAAALNPAHRNSFPWPEELGRATLTSPFTRSYRVALGNSPAALAYYPLLGLSLASFLLTLPRWCWQRFLPWAGLSILSAFQARTIPFFAVVAGPVLAWNVQDYFASRARPVLSWRMRLAASSLIIVLAGGFLVSAWPGWLQRPPFEPRQWALQMPAGLEQAAAALRRGYTEKIWPEGTRTLHLSPDTAAACAWFYPADEGIQDAQLTADLTGPEDTHNTVEQRLQAARISRVVLHALDRGPMRAALARFLDNPDRWPLLSLEGGAVVFGCRGSTSSGRHDPFQGHELDLDRLAYHPTEAEKAPPAPVGVPRRWWEVFWKSAPLPTGHRDEATVLLLKAEMLRQGAPLRHLTEWEADQAAALTVAAASAIGPAGITDAALRLALLRPPVPASGTDFPAITQFVFGCQHLFVLARDDIPPGVLYAAIRAARRAISANPEDARSQLLLGQCYVLLLTQTRERVWALELPQLAQLRQVQASTALTRAVALDPGLARAHLELGRLYRQVGFLDLALTHLRNYRQAARRASTDVGREAVSDAELADLATQVERQRGELASETVHARIADRARAAQQRGLAEEARTILLESDLSAFGVEGAELELDLLLRTGRADEVQAWTTAPLRESMGATAYHWLRTRALAALGDYTAADAELLQLIGNEAPSPTRTAGVFASLVGRTLLAEQPVGLGVSAAAVRAHAWLELQSTTQHIAAELASRANAAVLRGLLALEAGEVEHAREAFHAAGAYVGDSPSRRGFDYTGRPVAQHGLWLLR